MRPIEALIEITFKVMMHNRYRVPGKPGEVIERLPAEYREALKKLTSDDTMVIMKEYLWFGHIADRELRDKEYFRKAKLGFDKKLHHV